MTGARIGVGPTELELTFVRVGRHIALAAVIASGGCAGNKPETKPADKAAEAAVEAAAEAARNAPDTCPATAPEPSVLPGTRPEHRTLGYWESRYKPRELDRVLLEEAEVSRLNASMKVKRAGFYPQRDLLEPVDHAEIVVKVAERFAWLKKKFDDGEYVDAKGGALTLAKLGAMPEAAVQPALHMALEPVQIYCDANLHGYYGSGGTPLDLRIDHNACSTAHAQEPVLVLASWPAGMKLVRTRYTMGWIPADAALSPALTEGQGIAAVKGPFASISGGELELSTESGGTVKLAEGTRVVLATGKRKSRRSRKSRKSRKPRKPASLAIQVATAGGLAVMTAPAERVRPVSRAFTRRQVLSEAFRHVGDPYGFGGKDAGRDCSRLFLDVFESFGIELPRHSSWQSKAGSFSIELEGVAEAERLMLLEAANKRGVVLLELPGHIMMYLGRNDEGEAMALHAFAEYRAACEEPDPVNSETTTRVDRIAVSNLELGRGTSKTAFIERIRRITVFGLDPGDDLAGAAKLRPAAPVSAIGRRRSCRSKRGVSFFTSPRRPNAEEPLKILMMSHKDLGPMSFVLEGPGGVRLEPEMVMLGGPPYGAVVQINKPKKGRWKVVLGDGDEVFGCRRIRIARRLPSKVRTQAEKKYRKLRKPKDSDPPVPVTATTGANPAPTNPWALAASLPKTVPVWQIRRRWSSWSENLFALFVERLFDYPIDEDLTWNGLHHLLRDKDRNILYNYLGLKEDEKIKLFPDCAELSYTLRSYFSWKLGLPFAYTRCKRAKPGKPPECVPSGDNLMSRAAVLRDDADDVGAFASFTKVHVNKSVNSSSGRTHPDDEAGDYYPVALSKRSLRPGTLFNDPYGHVMIVADWVPQGAGRYGVLIAADAQPDGTVGRRRFWRGSFLWRPMVRSGGAGFKAYRPSIYNKGEGIIERVENAKLRWRSSRWTRYSSKVYKGTADDFYRRTEAQINPRPLDPETVMVSLVDALAEAVARRVVSVNNGEEFLQARGFATMAMPKGKGIFLSSGPWEDYSTPSRDLRLLISIDTVINFPGEVKATPTRFGLHKSAGGAKADEIHKKLRAELGRRTVKYLGSDGAKRTMTLAQVVDRRKDFEMAYNPNDCIEIRWATPANDASMKSCRRHAPAEQRAEMQRLRGWFSSRERPFN